MIAAEIRDMIGRLGCPAAVCPHLDLQTAELRQRVAFAEWPDWWDGHAEIATAPEVPMLLLRYGKGVNVATFNESVSSPDLNVWARIPNALYPLDQLGRNLDLRDHELLRIADMTHPAKFATLDTRAYGRLAWDEVAAYATHIPALERTVVIFGDPGEVPSTLDWAGD